MLLVRRQAAIARLSLLVVGEEGVCNLDQLGLAQLRWGPLTEACVLDASFITGTWYRSGRSPG
ncbi:hypothetical protein ACGFYQ_35455 [Streptomyces sp. NPDC048258]|uniref:hypothetical protein n=1 Tax=Streptomyces sp. NPDC048258 TaxID=3365527 RepID=UPI0037212868